MNLVFELALLVLILTMGASFGRAVIGPTRADRLMSIQLVGTSGVATAILLAAASDTTSMIDVALVLALLAAFAAVAFVKSATADGAGDPEEDDR